MSLRSKPLRADARPISFMLLNQSARRMVGLTDLSLLVSIRSELQADLTS